MDLATRMKLYEGHETDRFLIPKLPVCIRLDGRSFGSWTRGLSRPFDLRFIEVMTEVTKTLVQETNAELGYTQSDEISLVVWSHDIDSQILFNGKIHKIISTLAGLASARFNQLVGTMIPEKKDQLAVFDCRVWNVPTLEEACNVFRWREQDAVRNSISAVAQFHYSHRELHGKNTDQMREMIRKKGTPWENYETPCTHGTYARREVYTKVLTPEELGELPEPARLRLAQQNNEVLRSRIVALAMPPFNRIANPVGVVFKKADPILIAEKE